MPTEYKNDSPAIRLLGRGSHLMRLQGRVLSQMMKDHANEYDDIQKTVISPDTDMKKFVADTMNRLQSSQARGVDIELMLQIFFCRHYDNFEIFLEELVGDIARRRPELLAGIKLRKVDEDLAPAAKVEKWLDKIARLPLGSLAEKLSEEISFDLFPDNEIFGRMTLFSDVRNLLTHRYGIVDRHFFQKQPRSGVSIGARFDVTMDFTRGALDDMSKAAADIQKRAERQFGFRYQTVAVGKTEWWEEPDTPLTKLPRRGET
jgi:hypothetical protein